MPDPVSEKNIARYREGFHIEDDVPFCLARISTYQTDDPNTKAKIDRLMERREVTNSGAEIVRACNLDGCTMEITESTTAGREMSGECKAASFCLKTAFAEVGEGKRPYSDIYETLEGHADKNNAGNFCPRLDCGLSAGISIDMVPGTAGECVEELRSDQLQIDFSQSQPA
jgi:hypothetical protein